MIRARLPLASRPHASARSRSWTIFEQANHARHSSSRRLPMGGMPPADAHPAQGQRLVARAFQDTNKGASMSTKDKNALASTLSAALGVSDSICRRGRKVQAVKRPSSVDGEGSQDPTRSLEGSLADLASFLSSSAPSTNPKPNTPGPNPFNPINASSTSNSTGTSKQLTPQQQQAIKDALADLAKRLSTAVAAARSNGDGTFPSGRVNQPAELAFKHAVDSWADEHLQISAAAAAVAAAGGTASSPAAAAGPSAALRTIFQQILTSLLQETSSSAAEAAAVSTAGAAAGSAGLPLGTALLAAAAAAATAASGMGALSGGSAADGGVSKHLRVTAEFVGGGTADDFCPDAWEDAAAAAAAATMAETFPSPIAPFNNLTAASAAAAVAQDDSFDPSAWAMAAEAAAHAAASEGGMSASSCTYSSIAAKHHELATSTVYWAVDTLSKAFTAAIKGSTSQPDVSVQQLLLLPSSKAAARLLQLEPAERAALLLLLCGNTSSSRGDAWLGSLLADVQHRLGLLEMGVVLAAVFNRHGSSTFLSIARHLLPLNEASDPYLTASLGAMQPAGVLQALLLHWLLLPQLTLAGLPVLPETYLQQLLCDVVAALSSRQLQLAARWFEVWRVTQLQQPAASSAPGITATDEAAAGVAGSAGTAAAGGLDVDALQDSKMNGKSGAWCGLTGISVSHIAHVLSCAADALLPVASDVATGGDEQQQHRQHRQLSQGTAAAAGQLRAVAKVLLLGLEPMQPMLLLVMQQLLRLPLATASASASNKASTVSAAVAERQLQLLQVLLEAGSSSPLRVVSLAELIDSSFSSSFNPSSSGSDWGDAASLEPQNVLLDAAVDVLAALPADQLQHQLQELLKLQASRYSSSSSKQAFSHAVYRLFVSLAERADPAQAAALLVVLPMSAWATAWAAFVSPIAGAFCWTRQELAAVLAGVAAADVQLKTESTLWGMRTAAASDVAASSSSSGGWQKLKAAWGVVCAHFALGDVRQVLQGRPEAEAVGSTGSSSSGGCAPGVLFIGDGWEQDGSTAADLAAASAAAPVSFQGSLGAFVLEVLHLLAPAAAACHVAALVEVLPVDAFARLASQLLPPSGFSAAAAAGVNTVTFSSGYTTGSAAAAASLPGLQKSLLRLYSCIAELADAAVAVQLLAAVAVQLPIDRLPAFLTAAWEVCEGVQRMPWLPGFRGFDAAATAASAAAADDAWDAAGGMQNDRFGIGHASHNVWPHSSSKSGGDGSVDLGAAGQFELIVAAAAAGRDSAALQQMLAVLVQQLPVVQAQLVSDVLGGGVADAAFAAASAILHQRKLANVNTAADGVGVAVSTAFEGQVVWQLGQSNAAAGHSTAAAAAAVAQWGTDKLQDDAAAAAAAGFAADQVLVREVVRLVEAIPAAVPAGSFAMDAMQDPAYIAPLLKQLLSRLVNWSPSCPSAAAAVAQQITALADKRAWSAAEAGTILQRLPLQTALQLLLESDVSSSSSSSSGGGANRRGSWLGRKRGKLLLCLVDWHGFEETIGAMRTLFAEYKQASIAAFAGLLTDLQPAFKAGSCFINSSSGSSGSASSGVWGLPGDAPNPYIAAVLHVLGWMRGVAHTDAATAGSSSSSSSSWAGQLARVLCLLRVFTSDYVSNNLAEAIGRSLPAFGESFLMKSAGKFAQPTAAAAAAATSSWQGHAAELLSALPAAAAVTAGKGYELSGPLAVAVSAGVATAAGGAALLPAIRLAVSSSSSSSASCKACLAAYLPELLLQLQNDGLLTCGVQITTSSSVGGDYPSSSSAEVAANACINLQLVLLLQHLHQTDKALTLQQALEALVTLAPTLGRTLPQSVVQVFGHPQARGYGANAGPDTAAAMAAMEAAVAAAAVPTGAAVPAAVATAGKQLSEVLAYLHELLPEAAMQKLLAALAAALPWDSDSRSSSGIASVKLCPADTWSQQGGWLGVSCKQLISSSLLTASCAMWGFDKGTGVAHSLATMLAAAAATREANSAAAARAAPAAAGLGGKAFLQSSSKTASDNGATHEGKAEQVLLRAASTGASGAHSSGSSSISRVHAARAAAALVKAATVSAAAAAAITNSHAAAAAAALCSAAASGTAAAPTTQAGRAEAALHRAASSSSSSSSSSMRITQPDMKPRGTSSHAQRAQHAVLWAAASAGGSSSGIGSHAERAQSALLEVANAANFTGHSSFAWALQQLRVAAECSQDGSLSSVRAAVARMLSNARDTFAVEGDSEAAAALLAALPQLMLPSELAAQVLVQTYDLVPAMVWSAGLHATTAAAAAASAAGGLAGSNCVLQLLCGLLQEVQLQLRVNVKGPAVYAEVLLAAAGSIRPDSQAKQAVRQLLQLLLTGEQAAASAAAGCSTSAAFRGVPLAASAAAQLVVELSRRRTPPSSSSGSSSGGYDAVDKQAAAAARQLLVVGAVTPAVLQQFSGSSSSTSILVDCLADQLYQIALLPQLYLTMLLQPHVSSSQWITLVKQTGLTSGNTPQAAAGLALLCNTLKPGKALPLAAFAGMLATALDVVSSDSAAVAYQEARVGLEQQKQQRQQQLLAAVAAVLGTFRGMRAMHTSHLGAQLLLPMFDLAAVICYCRELLPADVAGALADAVARALGQAAGSSSSHQQLVQLLAQLPNSAAAGFGKGPELWMPLLQQMAVAGGMTDAEESELVAKLTAVAAQQGLPVCIAPAASTSNEGQARFSDPAAAAPLAAAAAARGAAGTTKSTAAAAAAGVTSHPVPLPAADASHTSSDEDDDADGTAFSVTDDALEVIAAVSLSVASSAAAAALAAGYGAAGALVGLVWGAAAMTAAALAMSGSDASNINAAEAAAAAAAVKTIKTDEECAAASPPGSPRTPKIQDTTPAAAAAWDALVTANNSSSRIHRAVMGGRTKAAPAEAAAATPTAAAAVGYAGSAMSAGASEAAAAAAQGAGSGLGSGFGVLGSLAVDPDEVVRKIRSQSAHMPLDEAVMQFVPLLLQYSGSSSSSSSSTSPWPLLALNAVLHAKHPALPKTLAGHFTAVNLALAAALSSTPTDGPLAALLQATHLLAGFNSSGGAAAAADREAALTAAEGVDPWAVSVQLAQRIINSLWEALMGGTVSTAGSSSSSSSSSSSVRHIISTPEGAAAAWQAIVTDLLAGTKPDVILRLLTGFVDSQEGWEAGLKALAVAAATQQKSSSSSSAVLQPLLAHVCKRNRHPTLAFLVLLLQQQQVQLTLADTAFVLDEALQQLLAQYGTPAADLAPESACATAATPSSSSSSDGLAGWLGIQGAGAGGEIDAWGFDALFRDLDVFGDAASAGPQYRSSSPFASASSSTGDETAWQQQQQLVAGFQMAVDQIECLVKKAAAKGRAVAAADFVMQLLALCVLFDAAAGEVTTVGAFGGSGDAQLVFVVSNEQQSRLLALAADCCCAALVKDKGISSDEAAAAAAVLPVVLPDLLAALAAAGQVSSCIDVAVAVCGCYRQSHIAHVATGMHLASMSSNTATSYHDTCVTAAAGGVVTAKLVGEAITAAAAAVVADEGSVSAAKPHGAALLAGMSGALFAADVAVEQCLVLLSAVAEWVEERLALQLVAASAAKLHSVMPQAVAVVRSSRRAV